MNEPLVVVDVAFGGKGVARHDGKVFFIPFTAPDDVVIVDVIREKKNFAEAVVAKLVNPSASRVTPRCPYFRRCGGCAYQHIEYSRQVSLKAKQVEQTLKRVGRLEQVPMQPAIPSPKPYEYRNRIRVHVENGRVGFFAHESHDLVDIDRCPISSPEVNEALKKFRTHSLPDGDYVIAGKDRGRFFEQTNDDVARELLRLAEETICGTGDLLVDAYCGAGFFAKHLTAKFREVIGIEENETAISYAQKTAGPNETYAVGDVGNVLGDVLSANDTRSITVLLDPPAAGLDSRVIDTLLANAPTSLIYVSCNPATLARDLSLLIGRYQIESVTPLDMFPQTAEIEVFAVLKPR